MRYQGGKARVARELAAVIRPAGGWWEPFAGGLNMSVELAEYAPGLVSDSNAALVCLYEAVCAGWVPPNEVAEDTYGRARCLPDTDPMKAFCAVCCSFGGKWFGGYAREAGRNFAAEGARWLVKAAPRLRGCTFGVADFMSVPVFSGPEVVYCDPPYLGTLGYGAPFDHGDFYAKCLAWARSGARVLVSEYTDPPVPFCLLWEKQKTPGLRSSVAHGKKERLFQVLP